jgi:hypothetical protein
MPLLKRITLVLAAMAVLSSSGCGPKRTGATYDPFAIFPATAQWAWDEGLNRLPVDQSISDLNVRTIVRDVVTEGLAKRGYTMASDGGKVDFRVHYQIGIGTRVDATSAKGYGALNLTLVNATTNQEVWLGFVRTESDVSLSENDRRKRLQKRVDKMLRKFPPSQ